MTMGEQLFLALVLSAFFTFGAVLAVVSSRTNKHMRREEAKAADNRAPASLAKAA